MNRYYALLVVNLIILFHFNNADGQETGLKGLKTPNSPGFQILDVSPSSVERPTNPKAFALSMFNLTSNGTTIPKNFAFEVSPYWYTKPQDATVFKYLNINDGKNNNQFSGIYNKLSVSLVSSYSDSTAGSLLRKTNYIAVGARTNLITVRTKKQNEEFKTYLSNISSRMQELKEHREEKNKLKSLLVKYSTDLNAETDSEKKKAILGKISAVEIEIDKIDNLSAEDLEKKIGEDKIAQENLKKLDEAPLFQLNAAYAYSEAIPENVYDNKRFNRSGFWVDMTLSGFSFNQTKLDDNLSITATFRFLCDNVLIDTSNNIFQRKNSVDIGGKLEYNVKQFSISIEYLKRSYSNNSSLNSKRTVGMIQYKINDNLYVVGTYGKNFGNVKNLFTLLGINWGFGNSSLKL